MPCNIRKISKYGVVCKTNTIEREIENNKEKVSFAKKGKITKKKKKTKKGNEANRTNNHNNVNSRTVNLSVFCPWRSSLFP